MHKSSSSLKDQNSPTNTNPTDNNTSTQPPIYKSKTVAYEGEHCHTTSDTATETEAHIRTSKTTMASSFSNARELRALQILTNNLGNVRYPGFSEFQSPYTLQNSTYIYSFPKSLRFNDGKKLLNSAIYTLPSVSSKRATTMGLGVRKVFPVSKYGSPAPDAYNLRTVFDSNLMQGKGLKFPLKYKDLDTKNARYKPGPGAYNLKNNANMASGIPIKIKFRNGFYYDDDLKKKKHCVSMQKYHPNTKVEEDLRFQTISFGVGERTPNDNRAVKGNPGPGAYKIPGCFDRGLKGKLALN